MSETVVLASSPTAYSTKSKRHIAACRKFSNVSRGSEHKFSCLTKAALVPAIERRSKRAAYFITCPFESRSAHTSYNTSVQRQDTQQGTTIAAVASAADATSSPRWQLCSVLSSLPFTPRPRHDARLSTTPSASCSMAAPADRSADTAEHISLKAERAGSPTSNNNNAPIFIACARTISSTAAVTVETAERVAASTPKGVAPSPGEESRAKARREQSPHVHSKAHNILDAWECTRGQQERQRAFKALKVAARESRLAETGDDWRGGGG